jgi:aquaporin related protein
MVAAIAATAILSGLTPGPLAVTVSLGQGTTRTQGLFIEMFTTAALTMSVLMLAAGKSPSILSSGNIADIIVEKHPMTPLAPFGFGFTLWVVMLFSVQYTGGAVK